MAHYNQWMNQKIYAICDQISEQKRKEDLGALLKSINCTLNHILYGDRAWIGRLTGKPYYVPHLGVNMYENFDELHREWEITDNQIIEWTKSFSREWLEITFEYTSNIDKKTRLLPTWL